MRTSRLLNLLQILRRSRYPVSGHDLAEELGISIRTLYRDIATLQAEGADIEGEPGVGYVLNKGFFLPPLMFSEDEMFAFTLGMKWVSKFGDTPLSEASKQMISKVERVVPEAVLETAAAIPYGVGGPAIETLADEDLGDLREAIRRERRLKIKYQKPDSGSSERIIWPIAIGFFPDSRVLVGVKSAEVSAISAQTAFCPAYYWKLGFPEDEMICIESGRLNYRRAELSTIVAASLPFM